MSQVPASRKATKDGIPSRPAPFTLGACLLGPKASRARQDGGEGVCRELARSPDETAAVHVSPSHNTAQLTAAGAALLSGCTALQAPSMLPGGVCTGLAVWGLTPRRLGGQAGGRRSNLWPLGRMLRMVKSEQMVSCGLTRQGLQRIKGPP